MRILLDENIPRPVRGILTGHDVRTVPEMGWAGYLNGRLLDEAEKAGFEALIAGDQNFAFQQNLVGRNIAVIIFSTNAWPVIRAQPQTVRRTVANASPATFTRAPLFAHDGPALHRPRPADGGIETGNRTSRTVKPPPGWPLPFLQRTVSTPRPCMPLKTWIPRPPVPTRAAEKFPRRASLLLAAAALQIFPPSGSFALLRPLAGSR
jgi:hypothetical protein